MIDKNKFYEYCLGVYKTLNNSIFRTKSDKWEYFYKLIAEEIEDIEEHKGKILDEI